jgi:hypothetical protein
VGQKTKSLKPLTPLHSVSCFISCQFRLLFFVSYLNHFVLGHPIHVFFMSLSVSMFFPLMWQINRLL